MENPNNGGGHVTNFRFEDGFAIVGGSSKDHHIVSIQLAAGDITGTEGTAGCCVVCSEPLEWVTVGRCGHRVVCSKCMVSIRYANGDKNCCVCRAHSPTVMVTKAGGDGGAAAVSSFREYWYHTKTAAYFDDLRQYQAAKEACKTKLSPYYHPLHFSILLFASSIIIGAVLGSAFAEETKHKTLKVLGYALSISVCLSMISCCWFTYKCNRDPYGDDDDDFPVIARNLERKNVETEQQYMSIWYERMPRAEELMEVGICLLGSIYSLENSVYYFINSIQIEGE